MQQVDGRRIAELRLDRPHIECAVRTENIEEELGGRLDRLGGVARVAAAQQAEIGDGFEPVEIGAGQHEEVAEHRIRIPVGREIGKAVEHVIRAEACLADDLVDAVNKDLEALFGVERVALAGRRLGQQRGMPGEAEVDQAAPVAQRGLNKGQHKRAVVVDARHMPDDVVARQNAADGGVERREARGVQRVVVVADAARCHLPS